MTATFNLVSEPWVGAVTSSGARMVGLRDLFADPDHMTVAAGDGLADRAVHRLLLAITYTALGSPKQYPTTFTARDGKTVARWLDEHQDQFDLLDPQEPFALAVPGNDDSVFPAGLLDPTLARDRALLTDRRRLDDRPVMSFADAALLVLVQQMFSVGGRHLGSNQSFAEGSGTGLIEFRPVGTVTETMTWARIPVPKVGTPNWTFRERPENIPGVRGVRPDGETDALTWLSRRITLRHDGAQVTGASIDMGWRYAAVADDEAPFDAAPGRRAMAVAADPTKPAKAAPVDASGYRVSTGDPVSLTAAWERGSGSSLSGQVRAHLAEHPQAAGPRIVASGHQVISKSLWAGEFTAPVPVVRGGATPTVDAIIDARRAVRPFTDPAGRHLVDALTVDDHGQAVETASQDLRVATWAPTTTVDGWPFNATSLFERVAAPVDPVVVPTPPGMSPSAAAALQRVLSRSAPTATPTTRSDTAEVEPLQALRDTWTLLREDSDLAQRLSAVTQTRVPTPSDLPVDVAGLPRDQPGTRLWVGLAAVWATRDGRGHRDASTPLPTVLKWVSRTTPAAARGPIDAISATAADPTALRVPLLDALAAVTTTSWSFSWRSLHHDLTHWNRAMSMQWRTAFWDRSTTNPTPSSKENPA